MLSIRTGTVLGLVLCGVRHVCADDLSGLIRGLREAKAKVLTTPFRTTIVRDEYDGRYADIDLVDLDLNGWRRMRPEEDVDWANDGDHRYCSIGTSTAVTNERSVGRRVPIHLEGFGETWSIEEPSDTYKSFEDDPEVDGLDPVASSYGLTKYSRTEKAWKRVWLADEIVVRRPDVRRLGGGRFELRWPADPHAQEPERLAVVNPRRDCMIERLAEGVRSSSLHRIVLQTRFVVRSSRNFQGLWLPETFLCKRFESAKPMRLILTNLRADVPRGLFTIIPQRGDVRREGGRMYQLGYDGHWSALPSPEGQAMERANARESALVREYVLWVLLTATGVIGFTALRGRLRKTRA